jgi:hypothetical protein
MPDQPIIKAAVVNHNTSLYTELMLRSLFDTHPEVPNLSVRVFDNASTDDMQGLRAYAAKMNVPVLPSGFSIESKNNSHGHIMRNFVLENPACDYFLFLDADAVFVQPATIPRMLEELQSTPNAFGANPQMSWDGMKPYDALGENPEVYTTRIHPFCALIKNTPLFRTVVEEVGLFCAKFLWADHEEYLDTFKLMTKVMKTHGLHHIITSPLVIHFFSTSYDWDEEKVKQIKSNHRDMLLDKFRGGHEKKPK